MIFVSMQGWVTENYHGNFEIHLQEPFSSQEDGMYPDELLEVPPFKNVLCLSEKYRPNIEDPQLQIYQWVEDQFLAEGNIEVRCDKGTFSEREDRIDSPDAAFKIKIEFKSTEQGFAWISMALRVQRGIDQAQLAELLNHKSPSMISSLERYAVGEPKKTRAFTPDFFSSLLELYGSDIIIDFRKSVVGKLHDGSDIKVQVVLPHISKSVQAIFLIDAAAADDIKLGIPCSGKETAFFNTSINKTCTPALEFLADSAKDKNATKRKLFLEKRKQQYGIITAIPGYIPGLLNTSSFYANGFWNNKILTQITQEHNMQEITSALSITSVTSTLIICGELAWYAAIGEFPSTGLAKYEWKKLQKNLLDRIFSRFNHKFTAIWYLPSITKLDKIKGKFEKVLLDIMRESNS